MIRHFFLKNIILRLYFHKGIFGVSGSSLFAKVLFLIKSIYLRKLQNNQERTMISYAKYKTKIFVLECSRIAQSFYWHDKDSSREFQIFSNAPETSV